MKTIIDVFRRTDSNSKSWGGTLTVKAKDNDGLYIKTLDLKIDLRIYLRRFKP
ncbi:MAG: hypothetical protein ACYDDB_07170 [bacterium]